jgi:F0F1-type ATP synthase epsilon subunit
MTRLKLTGAGLLLALVVSWSAIRHGLIDHSLAISTMFIRVGVAVALVMVGQAVLASVIDSYRLQNMIRRNRQETAERQQAAERKQAAARDQAA